MAQKLKIEKGEVAITEELGQNPDGSEAKRAWAMNADQAGKHLDGGMFAQLSAGDKSALSDCVNESRKEKTKQG